MTFSRSICAPAALAALSWCVTGCEPITRDLGFMLVLPEDSSDYEAADNASILVEPDDAVAVWEVDGLDFALDVEVEPSTKPRTMSFYLAEGEELIAWGRSGTFITAGADVGIAIFLGRPGRLSVFPGLLETPDPESLATLIAGRGMLSLTTDGTTALLSHFTYEITVGTDLEDPPSPDDGDLFGDSIGGALRLAYETVEGWSAFRFDAAGNTWTSLTVEGGPAARPGAPALVDLDGDDVLLLGGGDERNALRVSLLPDGDDQIAVEPLAGFQLDAPRPDASATWFQRGDDEGPGIVVFGGADPNGTTAHPLVFVHPEGLAVGPSATWTGAACVQLDEVDDARVLCLGGLRDLSATTDAVLISLPRGRDPDVQVFTDLLPVPMADPVIIETQSAVYAQGEGRLVRVSRGGNLGAPGDVREVEAPARRANGGRSVTLDTGATFLTGGWAVDGSPVDRWEVFLPEPENQPAE